MAQNEITRDPRFRRAVLFDALKKQAVENLKEMSDTPLVGNRRMGHAGEPQEATYEVR